MFISRGMNCRAASGEVRVAPDNGMHPTADTMALIVQ